MRLMSSMLKVKWVKGCIELCIILSNLCNYSQSKKIKPQFIIKIVSTALFVHFVSITSAQISSEDVIYLKNGSIIRGVIIEYKLEEYVKIESHGRNVWVFRAEEIDRIVKEERIPEKKNLIFKEKGYFNITDMGILAGRDVYQNKYSLSFLIINGYQFKNRLALGLGTGFEIMDIPSAPVLLDIRYNFLKGMVTPFIAIKGGYSFPLVNYYDNDNNPSHKGGYLIGSVIGIRNYFTNNSALVFSVGFRHQQLKTTIRTWSWPEEEREITQIFNRIAVRVGFFFN